MKLTPVIPLLFLVLAGAAAAEDYTEKAEAAAAEKTSKATPCCW